MNKNFSVGFTLIEILVVVGVIGMLMVATGGILVNSFKAKTTTEAQRIVQNQAAVVMAELKKNILDAKLGKITCPSGVGTSIYFETKSGGWTKIICNETIDQVASESAVGVYNLLPQGMVVTGCGQFVECELSANLEVVSVNFSFGIGTSNGSGGTLSKNFETKVTPR